MRKYSFLISFILITIFFGCQNTNQEKQTEDKIEETEAFQKERLSAEDKAYIHNLISSINPPIELSYIMTDLNIGFSGERLSKTTDIDLYENSLDQAAALGFYSSDFIYCLNNGRSDLALEYLESINKLAMKLNLIDVIDLEKLNKMSEDKVDANDLAIEFTNQMNNLNNHLADVDQLDISAMLIFSGWIESLNIASINAKELNSISDELVDIVYYETTLTETFLEVFEKFTYLREYKSVFRDLKTLKSLYESFEVEIKELEPEVTYTEDMTQVLSLSTQELKYNQDQIDTLVSQIRKIKNNMLILSKNGI